MSRWWNPKGWFRRYSNAIRGRSFQIDVMSVAVARPGDTVVFTVDGALSQAQRDCLRAMVRDELEPRLPGVRFVFIESVTGVAVVTAPSEQAL